MRPQSGPQGLIASAVKMMLRRRSTGRSFGLHTDDANAPDPRDHVAPAATPGSELAEREAPGKESGDDDCRTASSSAAASIPSVPVRVSAQPQRAEDPASGSSTEISADAEGADEAVESTPPELAAQPGDPARVICIVNQKGGVGKTTTAINLASSVAAAGHAVLLVDLDAQGNATSGIGHEVDESDANLFQAMQGNIDLEEAIVPSGVPHLDLVPSTADLVGAELNLADALGREFLLKRALDSVRDRYRFIFIDSPPSLGLLTVNALAASRSLLVPVQSEYYALEGLSQLMNTVDRVRDVLNPELEIEGVLLTMYDPRNNLAKQVEEEVRASVLADRVYDTMIPRNVRLSEAPSFGQPAMTYDLRSSGAQAYLSLAREVIRAADLEAPRGEPFDG